MSDGTRTVDRRSRRRRSQRSRYRYGWLAFIAERFLRRRGYDVRGPQPKRTPNASNAIRVSGAGLYLDSPENAHGVHVRADQDDGWLRIEVKTDDSIKGWALAYNGRDIPIRVGEDGQPV